jgi:hypothetical protein
VDGWSDLDTELPKESKGMRAATIAPTKAVWHLARRAERLAAPRCSAVFSLAVAFVCLAASLLVVTNVEAVRDRWSRAGRATCT